MIKPDPGRRIAIVGGGAAGTIAAVNLIRLAGDLEVEIVLIDRTGEFGPGTPYLTTNPEHRLNVATARMSAIEDDSEHFLRWMRDRGPGADGFGFVARGTYGRYLKDLLADAEGSMPANVTLRKVRAEVVSVAVTPDGATVHMADESAFDCDSVILALGPLPAGDPVEVPDELRLSGAYIPNAWDEALIEPARSDDSVLVIGAGLTMVDTAITLAGDPGGPVVRAISRNGLVPKAHRRGYVTVSELELPPSGPISMIDAMGIFLDQERRLKEAGGDWRDAMDSMRPTTPELWRRMPLGDRRWFIDNILRVWEVHRFRMAPEIAARFDELVESGRIEVSAGRVAGLEATEGGVRASLATGGGTEVIDVGHVINSTGASGDVRRAAPPLVRELIEAGCVRPDELRLGLDVNPAGQAIDAAGNPSARISLIGSIRRGAEWESIGVTEIRKQAAEIAGNLVSAQA